MTSYLRVDKHEDKVDFLMRFLNGSFENYPRDTPLMIFGSGGNGKSYILNEVAERSPIPIVTFGDGYRYYPTQYTSSRLAVLIVCNGAPEDFAFAKYMNANIVEFGKDLDYCAPS